MDRLNDNDDTDSEEQEGIVDGCPAQVRMLTPPVCLAFVIKNQLTTNAIVLAFGGYQSLHSA